jgi:hypothetical protein
VDHAHFEDSLSVLLGLTQEFDAIAMPFNKLHPYVPSTNKEQKRETEITLMRAAQGIVRDV